jgi:hypothetical protein
MKTTMRCAALAAGLVLCGLALAGPASASTFTVYDSKDFGNELITTLPGDNNWYVLYSVDIGTISAGDIIVVFADGGQLQDPTNTTDHYLTSHLVRTTSATATTGTEIDDANAMNITHQIYRHVPIKPAITTIQSGTTTRHFVNLLVQSASGNDLTVNQDYGRLQVLKISP